MGGATGYMFQKNCKKKVFEGSPSIPEELCITLLCRLELTMGTVATKLGQLNAMGIIGSQGGRAKW